MEKRFLGVFVILFLKFTEVTTAVYDYSTAITLYTDLTTSYNRHVRPQDQVIIRIEFSALSLNELDVKEQTFSITGWLTVLWQDPQLEWTPMLYNNIEYMFFRDDVIWQPELVLQNAANSVPVIESEDLYMKVRYDGTVTWDPPGVYYTSCEADITYYPFDYQTCYVTISTWSYANDILQLSHFKTGINFEDYSEHGEWEILSSSVESGTKEDRNEAGSERDKLQFYFTLKRKTIYYVLNVLLPPMLTSFLGVMVFLLPAESGEKVGYSITVLLALAVLLTIISDYMPTTSKNTSMFGIYLVCMMFVSAAEVAVTILILRLHHRADKDIPVSSRWQKCANYFLSRVTCFSSCLPSMCERRSTSSENGSTDKTISMKKSRISPENTDMYENQHALNNGLSIEKNKNEFGIDPEKDVDFQEEQDQKTLKEYSWPEIAMMLDIIAFYVSSLTLIICTIVFVMILSNHN